MSYLGDPFRHDLFVSYGHGAFEGEHESDLKLWSQKFAEDLRKELAGTIEFKQISVFLDESERSDQSVDRTADLRQLRQSVAESALLAILMSPHYLCSDWCRQEREWWCEKQHPDTLGAGDRIFVGRVQPTDQKSWPSELPVAVGYHCYDKNKEPDRARPYTWRGTSRDLDDYNDLLVKLSGDMMQRLRAIKEILEERRKHEEEAARLAAEGGQIIYLHGREEQAPIWQKTNKTLVGEGFVVAPGDPDPVARAPEAVRKVAESRVDILSGCDGLLLLATDDGRALDADLVVVGRQDRHSARARSDKLLPCAVLNTNGQDIATPTRRTMARALGIDWIDTSNGTWTTDVKSWLIEASKDTERVR